MVCKCFVFAGGGGGDTGIRFQVSKIHNFDCPSETWEGHYKHDYNTKGEDNYMRFNQWDCDNVLLVSILWYQNWNIVCINIRFYWWGPNLNDFF